MRVTYIRTGVYMYIVYNSTLKAVETLVFKKERLLKVECYTDYSGMPSHTKLSLVHYMYHKEFFSSSKFRP